MRKCILTFDDGFRSHFDFVRPLLISNNFTGTFFVCGSFIVRNEETRTPRRIEGHQSSSMTEFMSMSEIVIMNSCGFEIGNHMAKHVNMTRRSENELKDFARRLDKRLVRCGVPKTETIAYPSFFINENVIKFARDYGFKAARSGCARKLKHDDYQNGGFGLGFDQSKDDKHNVNCTFVFGKDYRAKNFFLDIGTVHENEILILCFHDFDSSLSVDIPKQDFIDIIEYLSKNQYKTMCLRDI